MTNKQEAFLPNSGFGKTIEDIKNQRERGEKKEKKKIYVVEASSDGGETWNVIGEYENENEAIKHKREVDHGPSGGFDYRVGIKE